MQPWDGRTYYDRTQLKAAPFNKWAVGGYVFLAGLSGASQLLSTLLDFAGRRGADPIVRRGRQLALLAPSVGSVLLVWDLHTPKRFYNMLRVVKRTSPMSLGTWILSAFTAFSFVLSAADMRGGRRRSRNRRWFDRWLQHGATVAAVPAAATGAGLGTYTAALLSATSTPLWAAAPRALATRFAASSIASGAAALGLFAKDRALRRDLDLVCAGALTVELAATAAADKIYRREGVHDALDGPDGRLESIGAVGFGTMLPLGLLGLGLLNGSRSRPLSDAASLAVLGGSLLLRVSVIGSGVVSARRPDISLRFTQPR